MPQDLPPSVASPDHLSVQPLIDSIRVNPGYSLRDFSPAGCADALLEKTADVALIPSIDFSRILGVHPLRVIPDLSVCSGQKSMSCLLLLRKDLSRIKSVAADTRDNSANALLKIILKEKYRTEPAFIPMPPDPEAMLSRADAAMITGDEALLAYESCDLKIDLTEDWEDLTEGLPFVFAFWAGIPEPAKPGLAADFIEARRKGLERIPEIVSAYRNRSGAAFSRETGLEHLRDCMRYGFGRKEQQGLREFYSYCYYYGLVGEIPDLRFFQL